MVRQQRNLGWITIVVTLFVFFLLSGFKQFLPIPKPNHAGIPHGSRARSTFFQKDTLQKKASAYPSVGQKKLNGAASRLLVQFAVILSGEIYEDHPSDVNRPVPFFLPKITPKYPQETTHSLLLLQVDERLL